MESSYQVNNVDETWAVARQFAAELKPGDIVCLEGDLGSGKTTFTQGLAACLGAKRAVTSPTFCLVVEHPTEKFLLVHMDLYRLESESDVIGIGWDDYIDRGAILAVEWPERAGTLIPENAVRVSFSRMDDTESRRIEIS